MHGETALETHNPVAEQEAMYRFPYHWFPEVRLEQFEREEKQRIVFQLIDGHRESTVRYYLDVGCGDGRWTADIHKHLNAERTTVGIDFSERAIGFARLISPSIDFRVHRGEDIPFPNQTFDLVSAIEVIEHVEDGKEEAFLGECRRVLKRAGLLILTTPSWNLRLTNHHFRHYSIERLTNLLVEAGFEIVDVRGQSAPCYGIMRKIRRIMGRTPKVWRLWKYTYRETEPEKALNLIVAAHRA